MSNINATRINNDVNGNPRYVVDHFLFVTNGERWNKHINTSQRYELAVLRAKSIGARKFHNKQYGGGIMWSTYGVLENDIDLSFDLFKNTAAYRKAENLVATIVNCGNMGQIKALFDKYTIENSWRGGAFPYVINEIQWKVSGRHSHDALFIATCMLAQIVVKMDNAE